MKKQSAKILICYNPPVSVYSIYTGKPIKGQIPKDDSSEIGFANDLNKIQKSLQKHFTNVKTLPVKRDVVRTINEINAFSPNIIYNLVESVEGVSSYEYCLTGVFELLGYHYTGNIPSCLGNCLNKARTKRILRSFDLKVPNDTIFKHNEKIKEEDFKLKFPVIMKLLNEDASIGISEYSVVKNFKELKRHLKFLYQTYQQDIIVEEYIEGKELNVAILGEKVLPISEIKFDGLPENLPKIVTYEGKWVNESVYYKHTKPQCPSQLNKTQRNKVERAAMTAFKAMGCRDYARVDIRLNKKSIPYIIEVNPNPDISMDSGFARAAKAAGMSHDKLLAAIADLALSRFKDDKKNKAV